MVFTKLDELPSTPNVKSTVLDSSLLPKKAHRRLLTTCVCLMACLAAALGLIPLFSSWMPSTKTLALRKPVAVDIASLNPGQQKIIQWRGKPVWIIRRTPQMLQNLLQHPDLLRDPDSQANQQPSYAKNQYRSIRPEFLVLVGLCTHLGCSPRFDADGFFCPCHGSRFDLAGRVFKNMPAPSNLQVPPHRFLNDHRLLIGEDPA